MKSPTRPCLAAVLLLAFTTSLNAAETPVPAAAEAANPLKISAATPAPMDYRPSIPDMMNIAVQPRHMKLAIAGRARNWVYAAYEIRELRSAFTRIARTAPAHDGWDTQALLNAMMMTPLKNVEDAIKSSDGRAFDAQFAALTEACNACHVTMGRPYIVMQVPRENAYPNQVFGAKGGQH
jgi:hypothetical protein